jgi:hypothetical protein
MAADIQNASRRTVIMAEGIVLYARVQDEPACPLDTPAKRAWNEWCASHTQAYQDFVRNEQFKLFDRVNAYF